jgi:hypothetical protein
MEVIENVQNFNKIYGINPEDLMYFQILGADFLRLVKFKEFNSSSTSILSLLSPEISFKVMFSSISLPNYFIKDYQTLTTLRSTNFNFDEKMSLNSFLIESDFIIPKILPLLSHLIILTGGLFLFVFFFFF